MVVVVGEVVIVVCLLVFGVFGGGGLRRLEGLVGEVLVGFSEGGTGGEWFLRGEVRALAVGGVFQMKILLGMFIFDGF